MYPWLQNDFILTYLLVIQKQKSINSCCAHTMYTFYSSIWKNLGRENAQRLPFPWSMNLRLRDNQLAPSNHPPTPIIARCLPSPAAAVQSPRARRGQISSPIDTRSTACVGESRKYGKTRLNSWLLKAAWREKERKKGKSCASERIISEINVFIPKWIK